MKGKSSDKLSVFKKEKEPFKELDELDELLFDDIEEGPGYGCTSSETIPKKPYLKIAYTSYFCLTYLSVFCTETHISGTFFYFRKYRNVDMT